MRVSTNTIFETGAAKISELQSALLKTQQQISANRRLLTPADDPIAAARALEVTQSQSLNSQYARNRGYAADSLNFEEGVLQSLTSLLEDAKTQTIEAGNVTYDDSQRKYIAADLRGRLEELTNLANSRDAEGNYLFSGFQTATKPFSVTAAGSIQYVGDQGHRNLQVGTSRELPISDSGDAVFGRIPAVGAYASSAAAGNTGSGVASLVVTDVAQLTGHSYEFVYTAGTATYSVYDTTTDPGKSAPVATGAYTDPTAVQFDGMQLNISGTPDDGDTFTVARPNGTQSIFNTLQNLITLLETPASTATDKQKLAYGLALANDNLSNALDGTLTIRASVGSRLKELQTMDSIGTDRDTQYAQTLSNLQDLDYVKAISDLSLQKTTLDAAQQSYLKLMNMSLFDYMK